MLFRRADENKVDPRDYNRMTPALDLRVMGHYMIYIVNDYTIDVSRSHRKDIPPQIVDRLKTLGYIQM